MFKAFTFALFLLVLLSSSISVNARTSQEDDVCKVILIDPEGGQSKLLVKANETKVKLKGGELGIQFFVVNTRNCECKVTASNPNQSPDTPKSALIKVKTEDNKIGVTYFLPFVANSISFKCARINDIDI